MTKAFRSRSLFMVVAALTAIPAVRAMAALCWMMCFNFMAFPLGCIFGFAFSVCLRHRQLHPLNLKEVNRS
jgi:hypothetical protein